MATIQKLQDENGKNTRYRVYISRKGFKKITRTFRKKGDAEKFGLEMESNIDSRRAFSNDVLRNQTFSWLADAMARDAPFSSTDKKRIEWWKAFFGETLLIDIDAPRIRDGLRVLKNTKWSRSKDPKKGVWKTYSPATVKHYKEALARVFNFGIHEHDLPDNPTNKCKLATVNNARTRFLSDDELKALLVECKRDDWDKLYLLVVMAITTGARRGNLLRLRWEDINFQQKRAYVLHETNKIKNKESIVLPLTADVIKELIKFRDKEGLVFPSATKINKPFEFEKHWAAVRERAGLENFRFHDLRHTCASYMAMNGATLLQIAEVLGHKQISVTQRYAHLCVDHKHDLIDEVFGGMFG